MASVLTSVTGGVVTGTRERVSDRRSHLSPLAVAVPLASLLVCNFADVATTHRLLSLGGREMNPVAGWLIENHWLLIAKLVMVTLVGALVLVAPPKRWIVPGLWIAASVYALIIAFHIAELRFS